MFRHAYEFGYKLYRFLRFPHERRAAIVARINHVLPPKRRATLYARYCAGRKQKLRSRLRSIRARLKEFVRSTVNATQSTTGWPVFRLYYARSYAQYLIRRVLGRAKPTPTLDLAVVLPEVGHGWILGGIAREVMMHYPGTSRMCADMSNLPDAKAYFILHYALIAPCLKANPHLWDANISAYYTHPSDHGQSPQEMLFAMNHAKIITMCSLFAGYLRDEGVKSENIATVIAGADPQMFKPHTRGAGAVGFCTAYYARKNPDRVLEIIRAMPHRQFILMGRNWERYERFDELNALPNFTYAQSEYKDYPQFYRRLDVLVSAAVLEGGPIPVIEAMMCNVVPVASKTGHCPDIIRHGENGFLFDTDAQAAEICGLIDRAYGLKADVHQSAAHFTWQRFTDDLCENIGLKPRLSIARVDADAESQEGALPEIRLTRAAA